MNSNNEETENVAWGRAAGRAGPVRKEPGNQAASQQKKIHLKKQSYNII